MGNSMEYAGIRRQFHPKFGGLFSRFCGIYNVVKFDISISIIKGTAVLGLNFQKFGCERFASIQKLLEDR